MTRKNTQEFTTIAITKRSKDFLDTLKSHRLESYNEVIEKIIENIKNTKLKENS